jgi:hypothetical protein
VFNGGGGRNAFCVQVLTKTVGAEYPQIAADATAKMVEGMQSPIIFPPLDETSQLCVQSSSEPHTGCGASRTTTLHKPLRTVPKKEGPQHLRPLQDARSRSLLNQKRKRRSSNQAGSFQRSTTSGHRHQPQPKLEPRQHRSTATAAALNQPIKDKTLAKQKKSKAQQRKNTKKQLLTETPLCPLSRVPICVLLTSSLPL